MATAILGFRLHPASGALACLIMLGTPLVSPAQAPPAHDQHLRGSLGLPAIQAILEADDPAGGRNVMIPRATYKITRAVASAGDRPIGLATELGVALGGIASEAEFLLTSGAGRNFYVARAGVTWQPARPCTPGPPSRRPRIRSQPATRCTSPPAPMPRA